MRTSTDIAVIGAGPYGLSIGAHLHARGAEVRVIGHPMETWFTQTPKGMLLKSDGFASNIADPAGQFTLARFCNEHGIPYDDLGLPVRVETFCAYGLEFQQRFVPTLERQKLVGLEPAPAGFALTLDNGEEFTARRVVLALGISYFRHLPPELAHLPPELVTHSADHQEGDQFRGREVAVLGAGASATNLAALLNEAGAAVQLITRRRELEIHTLMRLPRPLIDRIRSPLTPLGPSWRLKFCTDAPLLFHFLPEYKRLRIVKNHLGPAAGWFMRDRLVGKFPILLGCRITAAKLVPNGRIELQLAGHTGGTRSVTVDHVACGTGFRVDLSKIACIGEALQAQIRTVEATPILSSRFESSVPGLYFTGPASANSFGPMFRFACGARFTARRLAKHLVPRPVQRRIGGIDAAALPVAGGLAEGTGTG